MTNGNTKKKRAVDAKSMIFRDHPIPIQQIWFLEDLSVEVFPVRLGRCLGEYRGHVDLVLVETQDLVPMLLGGLCVNVPP